MTLDSATPVFFVNVTDRQRAMDFYCGKLGLELHSADEHGDFLKLGSALLRMTAMPDHQAHGHPSFGWNVGDMRQAALDLRERGIALTVYEGMGQDDLGIWTSPDGTAQVAWFADPDGNVLSLFKA